MKKGYRRSWILLVSLFVLLCCLTGCKASKKKVEESTYYKELLTKYEKLKKENDKLQKESDSQEQLNDSEKRAENYLAKIARDKLVKLEVGYADQMDDSDFVNVEPLFEVATNLALNADRTTKYTPKTIDKAFDASYMYILYDEDNAIYEITVYGSDYVVFSDLPKYVFYVPNASALGEAFRHYRSKYPDSKLLHRLADSPLMIDSKGNYYESNITAATATAIAQMDKTKTSRAKAEKEWKKHKKYKQSDGSFEAPSTVYTFFHHGNTMNVTLYDKYICVKNVDEKNTWYKVDKKKIDEIKKILREDREKRAEAKKKNDNKKTSKAKKGSHSKEIEEESIINSNED